jgi:hypothetical protein
MASCAYCDSWLLFGGKKEGDLRFCNDECRQKGIVLIVAGQIPEAIVQKHVREVHAGPCPSCKQRQGPIDVHTAHKIWSIVFMTSWVSRPQISCRSCGLKAQLLGTASSLLVGWWGIPWGLLMTPVQVGKNVVGMLKPPEPGKPSAQLARLIRINLASYVVEQEQRPKT